MSDLQQILDMVMAILLQVWSFDGVKFLVGHICINVVVAVAVAVKTQAFSLKKVGEFLVHKLLPYVSVYYIVKMFGEAAGLTLLAPVVWGIIEASLVGDLVDNLLKLDIPFPGQAKSILMSITRGKK